MTDQFLHRHVETQVARFAIKIFALNFAFILVLQVLFVASARAAHVQSYQLKPQDCWYQEMYMQKDFIIQK